MYVVSRPVRPTWLYVVSPLRGTRVYVLSALRTWVYVVSVVSALIKADLTEGCRGRRRRRFPAGTTRVSGGVPGVTSRGWRRRAIRPWRHPARRWRPAPQ